MTTYPVQLDKQAHKLPRSFWISAHWRSQFSLSKGCLGMCMTPSGLIACAILLMPLGLG